MYLRNELFFFESNCDSLFIQIEKCASMCYEKFFAHNDAIINLHLLKRTIHCWYLSYTHNFTEFYKLHI